MEHRTEPLKDGDFYPMTCFYCKRRVNRTTIVMGHMACTKCLLFKKPYHATCDDLLDDLAFTQTHPILEE